MSILLFLLVLFVLILVHEWGHFIVAKKTGMRVDEFGIGFPPKLFGIKKGETEYTFNALPIGGFVRILGENGDPDEVLSEADTARTFNARPKWAQALVLIAGVTMNVLFAWLLFTATFVIGVPSVVEEAAATPDAQLVVASVLPDSPAADMIPTGAVIESIRTDSTSLDEPTPSRVSEVVGASAGELVTVTYSQNGDSKTITLNPESGLNPDNPESYILGVSLALVETVKQPLHIAIMDGFTTTVSALGAIATGLWSLISQAVVGEADFSQVAGPVGIVGMVGDAAAFGLTALLTFTAIISLNLAVINLLPVPALDGGRLVFVAIEAVTGKTIPPEWAGRVNLIGFAILMLLMIAVTYSDITKLL